MEDLTDWFDRSTTPVHVGVYEVRVAQRMTRWFSYWNGEFWGFTSQTPFAAALYRWLPSDEAQRDGGFEWRGLKEQA
jgi:hypothetical protein